MQRRLLVTRQAQAEFEDSILWYERESEGLGERFVQAIRKKYDQIILNPNAYRIRFKGWREAVVGRNFSCNILFKELMPSLIVVTAIFHTSRDPRKKYWRWPLDTDE